MKIKLEHITIGQLVEGFVDRGGEGGGDLSVVGYGGRLDIRPPYQREFVYDVEKRDAVIGTVMKEYPLNVMYWAICPGGRYEIIDGQQRTVSICRYVADGSFSVNGRAFHNLQNDEQARILRYELMVYFCDGEDSEKIEWFKTINISGEKMTAQELRNAVYAVGSRWLYEAKRFFSLRTCPAQGLAGAYMKGSPERQEYLETVLRWKAEDDGVGSIEEYMDLHAKDDGAEELVGYFRGVVEWVEGVFAEGCRGKYMKGLPWGVFYNRYREKRFDSIVVADDVKRLMGDEEVTNKKGVYLYVIDGDEKHLNLRVFEDKVKTQKYHAQGGRCAICEKACEAGDMHGDHIVPWSRGGKTLPDNCQMLCGKCNLKKSAGV